MNETDMNVHNNSDNLLIDYHPDLLTEWDYEKNKHADIDVNKITCKSNVKAYWKCCEYEHSFKMSIKDKINGKRCPYCSGRKLLIGFNDLQTKYPDLVASEWDYENNDCKPYDYTYKSTIKVSWRCNECNGHYEMQICFKVNGCGCPYCSGKRVLQGYNDLQSKYPELVASEWDWIENGRHHIKPDSITTGSKTKAYWKCHTYNGSYRMAVYHKTGKTKRMPLLHW